MPFNCRRFALSHEQLSIGGTYVSLSRSVGVHAMHHLMRVGGRRFNGEPTDKARS